MLRRSWLDVWIYTFISAQTSLVPGISVTESARLFQKQHEIAEDDIPLESIRKIFYKIQGEVISEKKAGRQIF